ncbi:nucleotidyltransferase family protein [Tabrizicola sp.]|uniref:nucleotidyltransferase family protein n=1 Tax=Tabrizicola sp. TaxID=2005166 RepID=UPI003F3BA0C6
MTDHLRYAGRDPDIQEQAFREIIAQSPHLTGWLRTLKALDLPDSWIVSGAIYNQVWNHLTGRPLLYGIKDIDIFYFDPDLSYEVEDRAIHRVTAHFPPEPPIELRNEARVHLWYSERFGQPYPQLTSAREAIDLFASRTHAVGARLTEKGLELYAPYGLDDIFSFRLTPNPRLDNRATHHAKAERQMAHWPELSLVPWPAA